MIETSSAGPPSGSSSGLTAYAMVRSYSIGSGPHGRGRLRAGDLAAVQLEVADPLHERQARHQRLAHREAAGALHVGRRGGHDLGVREPVLQVETADDGDRRIELQLV